MAYYRNRAKKPQKNKYTAYETALYLLNYREQSEKELTRKLKDRDYGAEEIEGAMERLKYYGYIDDETLAEDLFEAYRKRGVYGDAYIHRKMKEKGLVTEHHLSIEEETESAISLLQKKAKGNPKLRKEYRRAAAFLLRRGFSPSAVTAALREFDFFADYEE